MTTSIERQPLAGSHRAIHADNVFGLNFPLELEPCSTLHQGEVAEILRATD
jgi:hypothetical protein